MAGLMAVFLLRCHTVRLPLVTRALMCYRAIEDLLDTRRRCPQAGSIREREIGGQL